MARHPANARLPNNNYILSTVNSMESTNKSKPQPINMMINVSVNPEKKIVYKFRNTYSVAVPLQCRLQQTRQILLVSRVHQYFVHVGYWKVRSVPKRKARAGRRVRGCQNYSFTISSFEEPDLIRDEQKGAD